ncbi:MAG TPA: CPBP family intramembrane glutamic endopeptidase [Steroidobacteraceae bacterium]|jgi:hypothetical protein|nr:CPBP family intramembrane glutamic endopeptidase [Steroidobacteraceae bacterium]
MASVVVRPIESASHEAVAPYWHTAILVGIIGLVAIGGAFFQRQGGSPASANASRIPLYLSLLAAEWGLFRMARKGSLRTGTTLKQLIGTDWHSPRGLLLDVVLGIALWCLWERLDRAWTLILGAGHAASIGGMLPRNPVEITLWLAVSLSAGFCEEVVFRGYCQRQFAALTHSRWVGVLLQALVFGVGHAYEGWEPCIKITLYGMLFGLLAVWRKSLRPGIICHAWSDIAAGLLGF